MHWWWGECPYSTKTREVLGNPGLMLRWLERRKKAILFQCLSLATKVIAEPVRWDICCLISTSEHENCLKICIFYFSFVQVPALSVEVYLRSRGSSRRQSHPGISIQSQSHPIPIPSNSNLSQAFLSLLVTHWQSHWTDWHLVRFYFCQFYTHSSLEQAVSTHPPQICLKMPSDLATR